MKNRLKQLRAALDMQQGDFANKIGILQQQLSKYERGENKPSAEFFIKLYEKVNVNINWLLTGNGKMFVNNENNSDSTTIEIKHYENPNFISKIDKTNILSIWLDSTLVRDNWKKNEKDLRIIQMAGDLMDGGEEPIKDQDILIIDTSINNILSGIYVYTTRNDNFLFINGIKQVIDGSLMFYYWNKNYEETFYKLADLEKIDFKIIGRVIKNLSQCY